MPGAGTIWTEATPPAAMTKLYLDPKSVRESQPRVAVSYLHYAFITSLAMNVFLLSGATSFALLCLAR